MALLTSSSWAQPTPKATMEGKVIGADASPVVGAEVKLRRWKGEQADPTFKEQSVKTSATGAFSFPSLEPGTYTVSASAKFEDESGLPCRPSGLLARNRNGWLIAVGRTADGGVVEIVTSDSLQIAGDKTWSETIDLRCR